MNRIPVIVSAENGSVRIFSASPLSLSSEDWSRSRLQRRLRIIDLPRE